MRREGYEFAVSRSEAIQKFTNGVCCELFENLVLDIGKEQR